MPELPEIETIRRGLDPLLSGRRIGRVQVRERRLREPVVPADLNGLRGASFTAVRRRSKYLLLETDALRTILIHLGMSGQLWISGRRRPRRPHEHVVVDLDGDAQLRYADSRRFGMILVVENHQLDFHPRLRHLGPEPLGDQLTGEVLFRATRNRNKPVKNLLLDTRAVAGIGNIYACETLHRSLIDPRRPVGRIHRARWNRLVGTLREVLEDSIRSGGTTFRDYLKADGKVGSFAVDLQVYDRENEPCRRCAGSIRRIVQAGRSTFFCPRCQT